MRKITTNVQDLVAEKCKKDYGSKPCLVVQDYTDVLADLKEVGIDSFSDEEIINNDIAIIAFDKLQDAEKACRSVETAYAYAFVCVNGEIKCSNM